MATTSSLAEDEANYGSSEVEPESEYAVFLRYPILYENASQDSDTNGIGALSDTLSCNVVRTRNQFPTLQLTYKRDGILAKELQNGRIIMSDMGPDLVHQKFRINQVQKSVDNIVVNATHIAGDIAYNAITDDIQLPSASVTDAFNSIMSKLAEPMPDIRFDSDIATMSGVNMQKGSGNVGNLLIDPDQEGDTQTQSLASLYQGEWTFDNYHYYLQRRGGDDTGLVVKYGRDLKTVDQDDNIANTYTAIYPYATYTPQPAKATDSNEDWNAIGGTGWSKRGTVTYVAGGTVNIYSSPVAGHKVVGTVKNGDLLDLVNEIEDGKILPDNKVVNTVNGDSWYYVETTTAGMAGLTQDGSLSTSRMTMLFQTVLAITRSTLELAMVNKLNIPLKGVALFTTVAAIFKLIILHSLALISLTAKTQATYQLAHWATNRMLVYQQAHMSILTTKPSMKRATHGIELLDNLIDGFMDHTCLSLLRVLILRIQLPMAEWLLKKTLKNM